MPKLASPYAEFLQSQTWDAVVTVTFKKHQRYPRKALELAAFKLKPFRKLFLAAEEHKLGGYHCHGLIEFRIFRDNPENQRLFRRGKHLALLDLGFNRVDHIRNEHAVSAYCTKHATKAAVDYEFYGNTESWR